MKTAIFIVSLLLGASAYADCTKTTIGSTTFANCDDGNSYTTQRFGGSSFTNGRNSTTGSTWSQQKTSVGNMHFYNGRDSNGDSWSGTGYNIGNTYFYNGRDSEGNSFSGSKTYWP